MINEELADLLGLTDWRAAMLAVPREAFVPAVGLACPEDGPAYPIDRQARPAEWLRAVYADASIITQRDDGQGDPADISTGPASSSLSAPGIAFRFLDLLAPREHDRVLEIGTGTGYTAAVLSARLGDSNISSVEIDPDVAKHAAANLQAAGYAPYLIVGDGIAAPADDRLFDRVHATCAVAEIPYAWVEQTRPGGIIVAPWQPHRDHGLMTRLTVAGSAAHGRFHGPCSYLMLRDHRSDTRWNPHDSDQADRAATRLDPRSIGQAGPGFVLATAAQAPGLGMRRAPGEGGSYSLLLFEVGKPDGSWAACDHEPGARQFEVNQFGDRRLWDELADAYLHWVSWGEPSHDRFGITVTTEGQRIWLDHPEKVVSAATWR
jgi:protein-L-isoaspartate(D-aspartate) O-methyltransferase